MALVDLSFTVNLIQMHGSKGFVSYTYTPRVDSSEPKEVPKVSRVSLGHHHSAARSDVGTPVR